MTAPVSQCQPKALELRQDCPTPPDDLCMLADEIELCRGKFLAALGSASPELEFRRKQLAELLWNDKGTFAPALRQAAEAASLKADNEQLRKALEETEADLQSIVDLRNPLPRAAVREAVAEQLVKIKARRAALSPSTPEVTG